MKRCVALLSVIVLSIAAPARAVEVSLPKPSQQWHEIRTENFRFFSNAGRSVTKRVAVDLEELRAVLAELTDYDLQSPVPTLIYVFKSDKSFLPFKTRYRDRPATVTGYFIATETANYIALNADSVDASAIVYHEYVHHVSNINLWYLPLWFSEGLAEVYESFTVDGDTVYIGLPILRHIAELRRKSLIPLDQFFAVDRQSELYNEADRKGIFYAQSWAMVHYLLFGDADRRQQLYLYLQLLAAGAPENTAFSETFSTDYKTLARELRGYLRGFRFPWIETTAEIDLDRDLEAREMPYAEVLYRLGELLGAQRPGREERLTYFEKAAEVDPKYGPPLSALAVEAERRADWKTARNLHQRASKLSPNDPMVLYRWGEFSRRRDGDFRQAAAILTRSTELDPAYAPAWAALAAVYADAGITSEDALEATRIAHSMRPSDLSTARDLVHLYLRVNRRVEAVALIETAFRSNSRLRASMWTSVIQRDLLRARQLVGDDRPLEAMQALAAADALVDRSLYPEAARRDIEFARRSVTEQRAADFLHRAQDLYSKNDFAGARELLERALEIVDEGPVGTACRRLLDTIDHPADQTQIRAAKINSSPTPQEIARYNQLIAAKDYDGALEFLKGMRGRVGPAQQEWIDDKIREIERVVDHGRFVDEYNRAVDLYNQQHYDEAVMVLERLLETLPEGPESNDARALLDDALAAQR
jgi:tetratricopeptide (TPR) repeat protein